MPAVAICDMGQIPSYKEVGIDRYRQVWDIIYWGLMVSLSNVKGYICMKDICEDVTS